MKTLLLGAVAYTPKVVSIWEGIRAYFHDAGCPLDFALFSNYERQVESLLAGHVDIAWNTPLAHVRVKKRTQGQSLSLGMRDADRDFRSLVVVRADAKIDSLKDIEGRTLAVGSRDSTQSRILPLHFLEQAGVDLANAQLLPFDSDVGKHGDTGRSELEVLEALRTGRAQAGTVGEPVWSIERAAGRVDQLKVLYTTEGYDHCMFDALPSLSSESRDAFGRALFAMSWDVPEHRRLLELEGLKQWMPPREEGYRSLVAALDRQGGW